MLTAGLQKLTLVDFPGKIACTVFTAGCNYRCPFCHNASLVEGDFPEYPENDILDFLKTRVGRLDGVAVTGGEPLLHRDLGDFLKEIKSLGFLVKLDTNGAFPDRLKAVLDEGLADYVAMDVKNSRAKYASTIGLDEFDTGLIMRSLEVLRSSGVEFETRTTVVSQFHEESDFADIADWTAGSQPYYLQVFRDVGGNLTQGLSACSEEQMQRFADVCLEKLPNTHIRG